MLDKFRRTLVLPENLHWAWLKVKSFFANTENWYDELELAQFELHLQDELQRIHEQFKSGRYVTSPLRPLLLPKKKASVQDEKRRPNGRTDHPVVHEKMQIRQAYWVSIRDQVAWTAVLNAAGPSLERAMPPWSYGNRLYRTQVPKGAGADSHILLGPWRNTAGRTYRDFKHCWPLFRRHIRMTVWHMARPKRGQGHALELDDPERKLYELNQSLPTWQRLKYAERGFWRACSTRYVYWIGLDLEKFYPEIKHDAILSGFRKHYPVAGDESRDLLRSMLQYDIDKTGFDDSAMTAADVPDRITDKGLPTNLNAAGFLANVAMLDADAIVAKEAKRWQVAHFRYVDDHVILAQTPEAIAGWFERYKTILSAHGPGPHIKTIKVDPKALRECINGDKVDVGRIKEHCRVDVRYPTPLMTATLAKLSELATVNVDLLDERGQGEHLIDLEHLLLTEFPEEEVRPDTRVSFAAAQLFRTAKLLRLSVVAESDLRREISRLVLLRSRLRKEGVADPAVRSELRDIRLQVRKLTNDADTEQEDRNKTARRRNRRVWHLLLRAVRDCPEKLRVWLRCLDFCCHVGHEGVDQLVQELQVSKSDCVEGRCSREFLGALLLQRIAHHILHIAAAYTRLDTRDDKRGRLADTLHDLCCARVRRLAIASRCGRTYYERRAAHYYTAALGVARMMLRARKQDRAARIAHNCAGEMSAPRWRRRLSSWAAETNCAIPVWLWWAERRTLSTAATELGPAWRAAAAQLDPSDRSAWLHALQSPSELPEAFLRRLRTTRKFVGGQAWREEALRTSRERPTTTRRYITLEEWVKWTATRFRDAPSDPRVGEWTSLEIVRQLAEQFTEFAPGKHPTALPAVNALRFRVPRSWCGDRVYTWEEWRRRTGRRMVKIGSRPAYNDDRYAPVWSPKHEFDPDWAPIHGLGMVLLGLLRRSLEWPILWNVVHLRRTYAGLVRRLAEDIPCSSQTQQILVACLNPRVRETALLRLFYPTDIFKGELPYERDYEFDPAPIRKMEDLVERLADAQNKLKPLQLMVSHDRARQLVPVSLEQLGKAEWAEEEEEVG